MSKCVIKLIGLATGDRSEFDGQYLVEYDPTRPGRSPSGRELIAHMVVSPDIRDAMQLDFMEAWKLRNSEAGVRTADGKPSRPLTAFHMTFPNAPNQHANDD